MKKKITNNIGLKILATLFSAILWLAVVNFNDPVITESYANIPVDILNQSALEGQGKVFEVIDNTDKVTVWITATRSTFEELSIDDIHVEADLKDVTYMDTVRLKLYTDKKRDEISDMWANIDNVKLSIEDMQRAQLVVTTNITGTPSKGYIQGSVTTDQNVVRLSGPQSVISQISKAVVEVSIENMSSTVHTSTELKLYDENGNHIVDNRITQNIEQVNVSVEILETKEIPIIVETTGTPAAGYITTGEYELTRDTITIAGKRSALDSVQSLVIPEGAIDISGRGESVTEAVSVEKYLPDHVKIAEDGFNGWIEVTIMIEEAIAVVLDIDEGQVRATSVPVGYEAEIEIQGELSIRITGTRTMINAIDVDDLVAHINVDELIGNSDTIETSYIATLLWNVPEEVVVEELASVYVRLESTE